MSSLLVNLVQISRFSSDKNVNRSGAARCSQVEVPFMRRIRDLCSPDSASNMRRRADIEQKSRVHYFLEFVSRRLFECSHVTQGYRKFQHSEDKDLICRG